MGAKFHSSTSKAAVVPAIAAVAALLASSGHADGTPAVLLPDSETVPCDYLGLGAPLTSCIDWCNKQGHYGGGFVHKLCCCGPRLPPPQAAKNY